MALSFSEKRGLQKIVSDKQAELEGGNLPFAQKRATQKALDDALEQLDAAVDRQPEAATQNQKLSDLIAGQYNTLEPLAFLGILKDISTEINDFEPLKEPAIKYIEANSDKAGAIMESAFQEAFGKLWGDATAAEQMILEAAGRSKTRAMLMPMPAVPSSSPIMVEGGDGAPLKITIEIDGDFTEPATFRDRIQAIESAKTGEEIILRINSAGGSTMSAQAFYSALLKTRARTKAVIINAYSSGSIVAMSCDEIELTPFCSLMIHNASGGTGGKLGDMAGYATFKNDYIAEWFAQLYAGFLTDEELKDVAKGQDFWLKEAQIRERLKVWKPIRERLQADGSVAVV
jgi:ATP-dependent protease ClpP protease subunit